MLFKDCICFQLGKSLKQVTKAYRNEISEYNLTHGQFFLLVALMEEEGGMLPSELSEKTSQDRAATTGLLDRLEKENWIERRQDTRDRRSLRIYLTRKGNEQKEAVLALFETINQQYLNRFTPEEWSKMEDFLNRLEM